MKTVYLDGSSLSLEQLRDVARDGARVRLKRSQISKIQKSRRSIERRLAGDEAIYGVTTGVGKLANTKISARDSSRLQRNIVLSHATGVGSHLPTDITRAILLLRINTLAKGYSGVRLQLIEFLLEMLNRGIHPLVPDSGSVGASGDLAPLAHVALTVIGAGRAEHKGTVRKARDILREIGLSPLTLAAKEGLSLVNGTQATLGILSLALIDAERLFDLADLAAAMSVDVLRGTPDAFESRIHSLRPHPGQVEVARRLRRLLQGSRLRRSHVECSRVQDAYSLRCIPQVHGACRDLARHVRSTVGREMNSVTDNPLVFADRDEILSGGNFHAQPLAFAGDTLAMALSEIASISERRIARMLDTSLGGLPPFLTEKSGLHSGFMIAHLTCVAAVGENKILSHPASVDSLPTSGGQEDHVSMSYTSATKLLRVRDNVETVLAIEFLCAAQALDLLRPLTTSAPLEKAYTAIRRTIPSFADNRPLHEDIDTMKKLLPTL